MNADGVRILPDGVKIKAGRPLPEDGNYLGSPRKDQARRVIKSSTLLNSDP